MGGQLSMTSDLFVYKVAPRCFKFPGFQIALLSDKCRLLCLHYLCRTIHQFTPNRKLREWPKVNWKRARKVGRISPKYGNRRQKLGEISSHGSSISTSISFLFEDVRLYLSQWQTDKSHKSHKSHKSLV